LAVLYKHKEEQHLLKTQSKSNIPVKLLYAAHKPKAKVKNAESFANSQSHSKHRRMSSKTKLGAKLSSNVTKAVSECGSRKQKHRSEKANMGS
jgi:hypothetical protein